MSIFTHITNLVALCRDHGLDHLIIEDEDLPPQVALTDDPNINISNMEWDFLDTLGYMGSYEEKNAFELVLVRHNPTRSLHLLKDRVIFSS